MDLIDREKALGCFWSYGDMEGNGYDETDMPAYDRLQALPIVAEVEDCISRQAALNALWKALYEYEDKTEKQFQESEDLDVADWIMHRNFVQSMNDIDRQTILALPSAQPTLYGYNIEHLELIARVLQKEGLPPERVVEALTDIGRIVAIVRDEFEETLRRAVEQCMI